MEKFSKSRCLVVLWFNDTPGLRSLVFAVISCSDSDLQDVDGILMFNTKGRTLAIFYLILSCLNYFYPFPYFSSHIPIRAVIDAWNQPIPLFCHFPSFSSSLSSLFGVTGLLLYCPTPFHCVSFSLPLTVIKKKKHMLDHLCSTLCLAKEEHSPTSYTFPFLHSCSLYALYPVGLQSPVFDQSGASMTCSCVYCQHRPVLGQLGEQEKARQ